MAAARRADATGTACTAWSTVSNEVCDFGPSRAPHKRQMRTHVHVRAGIFVEQCLARNLPTASSRAPSCSRRCRSRSGTPLERSRWRSATSTKSWQAYCSPCSTRSTDAAVVADAGARERNVWECLGGAWSGACGFIRGAGSVAVGLGRGLLRGVSGNPWERPVTVVNDSGRVFTGTPGNGALDAGGTANEASWPGIHAVGARFRVGSCSHDDCVRVSSRGRAGYMPAVPPHGYGRMSVSGRRGARSVS